MTDASLLELDAVRGHYPSIEPFDTGFLKVDDVHTLYYEQCGNKTGKPILFIHGGPGGGFGVSDRCFFDPAVYRAILFDQRGAGKSTPTACLDDNTTQHLISDIEKLRNKLDIPIWHVFGGSWGSTLALAYAQAHPAAVKALILRGIFLLRRSELEFFYQNGTSHIFPDRFDEYEAVIPKAERGDMIAAYHKRLTGTDEAEKLRAAKAWSKWECATCRLIPDENDIKKASEDEWALAFARIESHYFVNGGWMEDGEILKKENIDKIRHIPTRIVQGRYDVVAPLKTAWDLKKAFPEATLVIVGDAGHSAREKMILSSLVAICDSFREL